MSGGYGGFELLLGKRGPLHLVVVVYAGDGQFRVAAKGPCRIVVARFFFEGVWHQRSELWRVSELLKGTLHLSC